MTRRARRTDTTQAAIVKGLRDAGWGVRVYSSAGDGVPDLRVYKPIVGMCHVGIWMDAKSAGGELRPSQIEFLRINPESFFVAPVTTEYAIQMAHKASAGLIERGRWYVEDGVKA